MQENKTNNSFKNIIVVPHQGLGDYVACEPVSRYLKKHYPHSKIIWLCGEQVKELVDSNPYIDDSILINSLQEFYHNIKPTLDINDNYVVGLTMFNSTKITLLNYLFFGSLLEVFCLSANLPKICEQPNVYVPNDTIEKINKLNLPQRFIVVHRFSKIRGKSIDCDKWNYVLNHLLNRYKYPIVEVGGPDIQSIQEINIPKSSYCDLRGKLSILETAEVIKRADYFIGVDSGPAHLANAVKTPGIIILGVLEGKFKKYTPFCGFYRNSENVRYARNLYGPVNEIAVEKITEAIDSLFNNTQYENIIEPYDYEGAELIENFLKSSNEFILWGASGSGYFYKNLLNALNKKVTCFLDSDLKKCGKNFESVPVLHHSELNNNINLKNKKIIISSIFWEEISETLKKEYNKRFLKDYV
jgi:ADP-heptose:LPS heptosyltransferase